MFCICKPEKKLDQCLPKTVHHAFEILFESRWSNVILSLTNEHSKSCDTISFVKLLWATFKSALFGSIHLLATIFRKWTGFSPTLTMGSHTLYSALLILSTKYVISLKLLSINLTVDTSEPQQLNAKIHSIIRVTKVYHIYTWKYLIIPLKNKTSNIHETCCQKHSYMYISIFRWILEYE